MISMINVLYIHTDTAHSAAQEQARLEDPQATSRPRRIIKKPSRYLEEL